MSESTPLQLTDHEILALLAAVPGEAAATSREALRLQDFAENELLLGAGMRTLLVRGLAEAEGEDIKLSGLAHIVAAVFAGANEWIEMTLATPQGVHALLGFGSTSGSLIVNLGNQGIQEFRPVGSQSELLPSMVNVGRYYLSEGAAGYPCTLRLTRRNSHGQAKAVAAEAANSEAWALSYDPGNDHEEPAMRAEPAAAELIRRLQFDA